MRTLQNNYEAHAAKAGEAEQGGEQRDETERGWGSGVKEEKEQEQLLQWRAAGSGIYLGQQTVCVLTVGTFKMPP